MTNSTMIFPELGETTNATIEYECSYNGGFYLTTDLILTGRGVRMLGDGSDHKRNKKTYQVTQKAFDIIKQKYDTCYKALL